MGLHRLHRNFGCRSHNTGITCELVQFQEVDFLDSFVIVKKIPGSMKNSVFRYPF